MNEPKIEITVMPGAQMNGYVKEQHNYFGTVLQSTKDEVHKSEFTDVTEAEVITDSKDNASSDKASAATSIKQKKREKKFVVADGSHPAFPFIAKGGDPYCKAQVNDLFEAMKKAKKICGLKQAQPDLKDFFKCFTEGNTSSFVPWMGKIRELHFIVYEWKHRGYITFENDDSMWTIASKVFINPKKIVNGRPTFFDAAELRTARNPKTIVNELEEFVEMLNPDNPSPNYERFKHNAEDRIKYGHKVTDQKKVEQKPNAVQEDIFAHAFDDEYDDEKQYQKFINRHG